MKFYRRLQTPLWLSADKSLDRLINLYLPTIREASGSPGSSADKESAWYRICLQCRRPQFHPQVGKIPWRREWLPTPVFLGFPGSSDSRESTYNAGYLGSIPVLGRSPREGSGCPLQCSCGENSIDRGAWQAIVRGVTKSRTRLLVWSVVDGL